MALSARIEGPYLFRKFGLYEALERKKLELRARIESLAEHDFEDTEALATELIETFSVAAVFIDRPKIELIEQREVARRVDDYGRHIQISAQEFVIGVPFVGDPGLFGAQASTQSMSPPQGEVRDTWLLVSAIVFTDGSPGVRELVDRELDKIEEHLTWVRNDLKGYAAALPGLIQNGIRQRRDILEVNRKRVSELGRPIRAAATPAVGVPRAGAVRVTSTTAAAPADSLAYDLFISHASEDKRSFCPIARGRADLRGSARVV